MNAAKKRLLHSILGIMLLISSLPCSLVAGPPDQDPATQGPQAAGNVNISNAAPGKPTLVSPAGRVLGSTIAFTWRHVPGATFYYLWVDARGANRILSWYSAEQAGCLAPGSQTCSITVTADWDVGDGVWWIQAWNPDGFGPWSNPMDFKLNRIQGVCGPEDAGVTNLLFPFATNQVGFDTGIAIANTGKDPLGTVGATGTCTVYFYGTNAPAALTSSSIAPGTVYTMLLSIAAPNFQGYIIARCRFPYAHGWAFVSDLGAAKLGMSYLSQILCNNRMPVEQLLQ